MPTVSFIGRVLPATVQISYTDIPKPAWEWTEENLKIEFKIQIKESRVQVDCLVDQYKDDYMGELHRRSFELARACVNVAAFGTGYGLYLIFEQFIRPDGVVTQLLFTSPPDFVAECTAFKLPSATAQEKQTMEQVLAIAMDPALSMLLNDLIQCLSVPNIAPVNCGRVLDGLRKLVVPGMNDPKAEWPIFRAAMRVDENYTQFVSEHSKNPRHGQHMRIDGPTTIEIHRRAWVIMNRFLEYRKRGSQPLPATEFPLLTG
jgi:hypothetical protein